MTYIEKPTLIERLKTLILGRARNPEDRSALHNVSLIAFFAWVGLGADGLSSSAYGPEEAFLALGGHHYLGVFVAFATVATIWIISASYSQIVEVFPSGGGGYVVASKLLSPTFGMISGSALLIDYVLTITISIASGADALFSFLPVAYQSYKLTAAVFGILLLIVLNLRGVKESVVPLVPIFLVFIISHVIAILYAAFSHALDFPMIAQATVVDVNNTYTELGFWGMFAIIMRAYSMGAGTYTGIEAVSNGLPILRDPKVKTAKHTMRYMAISLAFMVLGLMFGYLLYSVEPVHGKTLNAVLFERMTAGWSAGLGKNFVLVLLVSEAAILFVAAQAGFLDGPRVLSSMALDRWIPTKFAMLSDRLVTQNGVLLMGGAALITLILSGGSVRFLVVLYSINVFITFTLSQLGMVRYWWKSRKKEGDIHWRKGLLLNGVGLILCAFILCAVVVLKFHEGGWVTLLVTGLLITGVLLIRRHYNYTGRLLKRLDGLLGEAAASCTTYLAAQAAEDHRVLPVYEPDSKTAVLLVSGFNGLGLHTLFSVLRLFGDTFKNFVFIQVGVIDAGVFKGHDEIEHLRAQVKEDVEKYVTFIKQSGYYAEGFYGVGIDVVEEVLKLSPEILEKFPQAVFFGGQILFPKEPIFSRWLHNYTVFALQRRFYHQGVPVVILPIRV